MTGQLHLLVILLKIALPFGFFGLIQWVAVYTVLERRWYRQAIGQTLVTKTLIVAALLMLTSLSVYFNLNRYDEIWVAWIEVALIFSIFPVMVWRSVVWVRTSRMGRNETEKDKEQPVSTG